MGQPALSVTTTILSATTPPQITAACTAIETFLTTHSPTQTRPFFTLTFPTLISKLFGFETSQHSPSWIQSISNSNDPTLSATLFALLSPKSILMNSIFEADHVSLLEYVFPVERLPEWIRIMLQNEKDFSVLAELCPLFRGRISRNSLGFNEFRLNVFEYYLFWFAYYPVCKRNVENVEIVKVTRSDRFNMLENWACSIPVLKKSSCGGRVERDECGLYVKLLYAYLREYVCVSDLSVGQQPYCSSLFHYSGGCGDVNFGRTEFMVYTLINFWLVGNDFSPLALNVCNSFGVNFSFRSLVGETNPTEGLGEIVNVFVKYLNLISMQPNDGLDKAASTESPEWRMSGNVGVGSVGSWNLVIQRPFYRL